MPADPNGHLERRVLVALAAFLAPLLVGATTGGTGPGPTTGGSAAGEDTGSVTVTRGDDSGHSGFDKAMGCGCAHGRPLSGLPLPPGVVPRGDWRARGAVPRLDGLDPAARERLGWFWSSVALAEHASIGSFYRAALELARAGGPHALVAALERGAADERRHARRAFSLASAFAGRSLGPAPADPAPVPVAETLATLAARTVHEGCGEEARSLAVAVAMREVATDPAVVAVLDGIVRDEVRHVHLAFRVARWAARSGGPEVAAAVRRAALAPLPRLRGADSAPSALAPWGLLGDDALAAVVNRADAELLAPMRAQLAA